MVRNRMKRYADNTPSAYGIQYCIDQINASGDIVPWAKMRCETLLRRAIPVKPVGKHTQMTCGVCGCRIRSGNGSSSFVYDTVCRNCFTVIDWGQEG